MSKIITNQGIIDADENTIQHYGVLGMKWGVRRYQQYGEGGYLPKAKQVAKKTYGKSIKKLDKLDKKSAKYKKKSAVTGSKSAQLRNKSEVQELKAHTSAQENRAHKTKLKSGKYYAKSMQYNKKSIKNEQKAEKWADKMNKILNSMARPSDLTEDQKRTLKKHALESLGMSVKESGSTETKKKNTFNRTEIENRGYKINNDLGGDFYSKKKQGVNLYVEIPDDNSRAPIDNAKVIESNLSKIKSNFYNTLKKEGYGDHSKGDTHITIFPEFGEIIVYDANDGHDLSMYIDPKTGKLEKGVMRNG